MLKSFRRLRSGPHTSTHSDAIVRSGWRDATKSVLKTLLNPNQPTVRIRYGWRRGVAVSGIRRMNVVSARRTQLVPDWVTVYAWAGISPQYVTSQLGQLSLAGVKAGLSALPGGG